MYKDHFRLRAMPFSIAPDPSYFYLSNQHRDALSHLRHALVGDANVLLLTGEIGAGKTTVCRRLLSDLPRDVNVALIYNPRMSPRELLATLCQEFGIPGATDDSSRAELLGLVLGHVAQAQQAGKTSLLIIDEAQNLSSDVIEQIRRLSETGPDRQAGLRIVLIGQPELNDLLARPRNARFNEIIGLRYHLGPLARDDVAGYVQHRLHVAGGAKQLFPLRLMARLHRMSEGIPRVINLICDRALLGACVLGKDAVNGRILKAAYKEAVGKDDATTLWRRFTPWAIGGASVLAAGACLAVVLRTTAAREEAVALPPTAEAPAVDLDPANPSDWPDGMAGPRSEALAFAALLKRWNVAGDGEPPCSPRLKTGLKCIQGRDELEDLRRLNMPVMLQLIDRNGRKTQVALVQLTQDHAVLQLGHTVRRVPIAALESQWTRRYTLLWRPPPALAGTIEADASGPQVEWIRQRIAKLRGLELETLPPKLEGALKSQVQAFQTLEGLRATGTGDLRTLVHLASRTEPDAPTLEAQGCTR